MAGVTATQSCPFSFVEWFFKDITAVYAGKGCVMAMTGQGEVLQKVSNPDLAARMEYWTNIQEIAISQCFDSLALGLEKDGTCMVAKRALRRCCEITGVSFDWVNSQIRELKQIVKICVSDAIFALDSRGKVHCIPLTRQHDYHGVASWENIVHICAGNQCSVFGITAEGKVLCAGHNCVAGPRGDLREKLASCRDVADICSLGSEGERVVLAFRDGTAADLSGEPILSGIADRFQSNFCLGAVLRRDGTLDFIPYHYPQTEDLEKLKNKPIKSFAVGLTENYNPFVIAVKE